MRRGGGRTGNPGRWPGNGPFRNLPPWERPGWLYGRGSCWYMGYQPSYAGTMSPVGEPVMDANELNALRQQKELLEAQLRGLQEGLSRIEARLRDLQDQ